MYKREKIIVGLLLLVSASVTVALINNRVKIGMPDADGFYKTTKGELADIIKWIAVVITFFILWAFINIYERDKIRALLLALVATPVLLIIGYVISFALWFQF